SFLFLKGFLHLFSGISFQIGTIKDRGNIVLYDSLWRTYQKIPFGVNQIDIAAPSQDGVPGQNVRENLNVVAGGQSADYLTAIIDGNAVYEYAAVGDDAF